MSHLILGKFLDANPWKWPLILNDSFSACADRGSFPMLAWAMPYSLVWVHSPGNNTILNCYGLLPVEKGFGSVRAFEIFATTANVFLRKNAGTEKNCTKWRRAVSEAVAKTSEHLLQEIQMSFLSGLPPFAELVEPVWDSETSVHNQLHSKALHGIPYSHCLLLHTISKKTCLKVSRGFTAVRNAYMHKSSIVTGWRKALLPL